MPNKKRRTDLILFGSDNPQPLVNWLCENFGLQTILQSVAEFRPSNPATEAPAKRAYKKRGSKKGGAKKTEAKKGGKRRRRTRAQMESDAAKN